MSNEILAMKEAYERVTAIANELEAENKRLRDALKQIAYGASTNCGNCIDCNSINQIANEILDAPRA
jgi:hypothetical protein